MKVLYTLFFCLLTGLSYSESHRPQSFLKTIQGAPNEGEQIYQHFCVNCHDRQPIITLGAPRILMEDDWKPRVKQGLNELFKHTDEGLNAMPSRGGCFECTDHQLFLAIIYMLPEPLRKLMINEKKIIKNTKSKNN